MKNAILSREEEAIERNFEKYRPVSKETKNHIEKLIEGSRKSRPISLRINENDLERLKEKANKNGLPYQTMINVVIHKYVTDSYLDKEEINKFLQLKKVG
jgi:predicted DNA binding CopG/RHH family protein